MSDTDPPPHLRLPAATCLSLQQRAQLSDTPAHAAATAVAVAGELCPDPVRARNAASLFPLAVEVAVTGDATESRRKSGMVVTLVECASTSDPACRPLMLALERWMLHPGADTAAELTTAAREYAASAPDEKLRRCWSVGAGLDAAIAEINRRGIRLADAAAIEAVELACDRVVSHVWVAQRCGVSREALYRRARDIRHTAVTSDTH